MTIPIWVDRTIEALYGKDYSAGARLDAAAVKLLRDYVEPMWAIILNRFPGTPRPEPLIVPVDSPAGSPTTFTDNGTEVLAFDMHLLHLISALTIMTVTQADAEIVVPALASIYAERAFSAGNIKTAAGGLKRSKQFRPVESRFPEAVAPRTLRLAS
jgi:hypothetical protein